MVEIAVNEIEEEVYLLELAEAALMELGKNPKTYTLEETMADLGITQEDIDEITDEELNAFCKTTAY